MHAWACLDEGCNASVHSASWMRNYQKKAARYGLVAPWVHREVREYTGIGSNRSVGKRRIAFAIHLDDIETTLPGYLDSNEMEDGDTPLLVSLPMQHLLGVCKNTMNGEVTLERYNGARLKVAQCSRTGMLCFNLTEYLKNLDADKHDYLRMEKGCSANTVLPGCYRHPSPDDTMTTYASRRLQLPERDVPAGAPHLSDSERAYTPEEVEALIRVFHLFRDFWQGGTTIVFKSTGEGGNVPNYVEVEWQGGTVDHRDDPHIPADRYLQNLSRMDNFRGASKEDWGNDSWLEIAQEWHQEAKRRRLPWTGPEHVMSAVKSSRKNSTYQKCTDWVESHLGMTFSVVSKNVFHVDENYVMIIYPDRDPERQEKTRIIHKIWKVLRDELDFGPKFDPDRYEQEVWKKNLKVAPKPVSYTHLTLPTKA